MSLLVPLYVHPAEDPAAWHRLVSRAADTYAVVLNPASGPGRTADPAFAAAAAALRTAGARLLGYVDTDYGARDPARIAADLRLHQEWYGADGRLPGPGDREPARTARLPASGARPAPAVPPPSCSTRASTPRPGMRGWPT
ncbi:hypothetical protein SGLAM104S_09451 [Streptomyces glaucescens]